KRFGWAGFGAGSVAPAAVSVMARGADFPPHKDPARPPLDITQTVSAAPHGVYAAPDRLVPDPPARRAIGQSQHALVLRQEIRSGDLDLPAIESLRMPEPRRAKPHARPGRQRLLVLRERLSADGDDRRVGVGKTEVGIRHTRHRGARWAEYYQEANWCRHNERYDESSDHRGAPRERGRMELHSQSITVRRNDRWT